MFGKSTRRRTRRNGATVKIPVAYKDESHKIEVRTKKIKPEWAKLWDLEI